MPEATLDSRIKDPEWRVNHLYKIVDKDSRLVTFKRNSAQTKLNKSTHPFKIILKARQLGITTDACITGLDEVIFKRNFNMFIIAHDKDSLLKIFKKIKLAWENFDPSLKAFLGIEAKTDRANQLSFNNGSTIAVGLSSRSDTVNWLHVSEFGKICKKYPHKEEEIITGAFQSVPKGGKITIESTAEGEVGSFYEMFWEAYENKPQSDMDFEAFFFPWTDDSQYQSNAPIELTQVQIDYAEKHGLTTQQSIWYALKQKTLKAKMPQEYPTTPEEAFLSSGDKYFYIEDIEWQESFLLDGRKDGDWIIYKPFNPEHTYAIGADVSEGIGRDSSTAVVFDFTTMEVVAIYRSKTIEPDEFGEILYEKSLEYGKCIIAPERNSCGLTTVTKVRDLGGRLFYEEEHKTGMSQPTRRLGFRTTSASKPKILSGLKTVMKERSIKIISKVLLRELRTYDRTDIRKVNFDEKQTRHWDLLMALAIVWEMRDQLDLYDNDDFQEKYDDYLKEMAKINDLKNNESSLLF